MRHRVCGPNPPHVVPACRASHRQMARPSGLSLLGLLVLSLFGLGCITMTIGVKVAPKLKEGDEQEVWFIQSEEMDDLYLKLANEANADMQAQYRNYFKPSLKFPTALAEFPSGLHIDSATMTKNGFTLDRGYDTFVLYRRSLPLQEYIALKQARNAVTAPAITVTPDPITGNTFYRVEFTFPGFGDNKELANWDWNRWDTFRAQPQSRKPQVDLSTMGKDVEFKYDSPEAKRAMTLTGLDQILGSALGSIPSLGMTELKLWWAERILKEVGFPAAFRFGVSVPGKLTKYEIDGHAEGRLNAYAEYDVVFDLDEAFFRKYGFGGPWHIVVESVQVPERASTDEEKSENDTRPGQGASDERFRKFRLRAVGVGLGVNGSLLFKWFGLAKLADWLSDAAPYVAWYELTELRDDGSKGRTCLVRFTGTGLSIGLPVTAGIALDTVGTEFETRKGLRLEDFDGMAGTMTSLGAVVASYAKITFGVGWTKADIVGEVDGLGAFLGIHGGWSPLIGRWDIVEPPRK